MLKEHWQVLHLSGHYEFHQTQLCLSTLAPWAQRKPIKLLVFFVMTPKEPR